MRRNPRLSSVLTLVPTAAVALVSFALAWREQGSVLAEDWLPYALATGLMLATVLASGYALLPAHRVLAGLAALAALTAWTRASAWWSPVPALARDEALLVAFYALALAVCLVTLRSEGERLAAVAIVVATSACLALATSIRLIVADAPADLYWEGRLGSPIRYPGADSAFFLVSFWPAAALAASRRLNPGLRALALGGAVALLAGLLMAQSRAGTVSLALSAVVVFGLAPARLRLLVPTAVAAAVAGFGYGPLTEPFQAEEAALAEAITDAGKWALALSSVGAGVGLVYALADRRFSLRPSFVRVAGYAAVAVVGLSALAGLGGFLVTVDEPSTYLQKRWGDFKDLPERETGSSHLVTVGSSRYDFWRVALGEFHEHPVAGAGGRSFGVVYLRDGRTDETPKRGHSFPLDVLSETGLVGFGLLVLGLAPFVWTVLHRATSGLVATGVLGGVTYWLVHASADWTWTFPAAGVLFFALLGIGASGNAERRLRWRFALPAGVAIGVAALLLFTPPWLSSRYTAQALGETADAAADELRLARRLDPLSVAPLVAEATLAPTPKQAIPPLEEAVRKEPRSLGPRYVLAQAYLEAGRRAEGRRELRQALELAPRSPLVQQALDRAEAPRGGG